MKRVRATPLRAEDRRQHIKDAVIPLLAEHGLGVSTKLIADAAGIAEGTIYKVFSSKDELINEALAEAFSPQKIVEQLDAIDRTQPLTPTIKQITTILHTGIKNMRQLLASVPTHSKLMPHHHDANPNPGDTARSTCPVPAPAASHKKMQLAVEEIMTAHLAELRINPELAAQVIIGLVFAGMHPVTSPQAEIDPDTITDIVINGIATGA